MIRVKEIYELKKQNNYKGHLGRMQAAYLDFLDKGVNSDFEVYLKSIGYYEKQKWYRDSWKERNKEKVKISKEKYYAKKIPRDMERIKMVNYLNLYEDRQIALFRNYVITKFMTNEEVKVYYNKMKEYNEKVKQHAV